MTTKTRIVLIGLLMVELAAIPAAAQIVQRVSFESKPIVTAVEIPTAEPGKSRFLVASNAGFIVSSNNLVGDVNISIHVSGTIEGGSRFGDAAHLPGAANSCAFADDHISSAIYEANRKTAETPGTAVEQAVVFEFTYHPDASPDFRFSSEGSDRVQRCTGANS